MRTYARTAVVDESFRRGPDGRGLFLLTAVIVPDHVIGEIEQRLRRMLAPGQQRWHFRDQSAPARRRFISEVAELQQLGVQAVTFCCRTPGQRQVERSRVRCIWNLVSQLTEWEVRTLMFESRQAHLDRNDRREIHQAIIAGVAHPTMAYWHRMPVQEPLLWLPDAVAGAVGLSIAEGSEKLIDLLPAGLCEVRWIHI